MTAWGTSDELDPELITVMAALADRARVIAVL
jgi:hypothetical protein